MANYIKTLQEENKQKQETIDTLERGLNDLLRYINSEKFNGDGELSGYVNVRDIALRVNEIKSQLN